MFSPYFEPTSMISNVFLLVLVAFYSAIYINECENSARLFTMYGILGVESLVCSCHTSLDLFKTSAYSSFMIVLLVCLRDEDKGLVMMAKHEYPVNACRLFNRFSLEKLEAAMRDQKTQADADEYIDAKEVVHDSVAQETKKGKGKGKTEKVLKEKKVKTSWGKKEDTGRTLKSVLGGCLGYGPALCEHIVLDSGLQSGMKVSLGPDGVLSISKENLGDLMGAISRFEDWLDSVVNGDRIPEGFVYMQKKNIKKDKVLLDDQLQEEEKVGI